MPTQPPCSGWTGLTTALLCQVVPDRPALRESLIVLVRALVRRVPAHVDGDGLVLVTVARAVRCRAPCRRLTPVRLRHARKGAAVRWPRWLHGSSPPPGCAAPALLEFHRSEDWPLRFSHSRQGTTALVEGHVPLLRRASSDTILPARSHCGTRDNREH